MNHSMSFEHVADVRSKMVPKPQSVNDSIQGSRLLDGKTAVITGGDSGIGRATAIAFAREGANVVFIYLEETEDAESVQQEVRDRGTDCLLIKGDIGREAFCQKAVERAIKKFGRIDVLVNNTAEQHPEKKLDDIDEQQLVQTFRTYVFAMSTLMAIAIVSIGYLNPAANDFEAASHASTNCRTAQNDADEVVPMQLYNAAELNFKQERLPAGEFSIVLVGDIMPWNSAKDFIEREGPCYPFVATKPLLQNADFCIGNLEGPVAVHAETRTGLRYPYRMPPLLLKGIKNAGFDLLGTANNHLLDCGEAGVGETLSHLDRAGILHTGSGLTRKEACKPAIVTIGNKRVAVLAFVSPETWFSGGKDAEAAHAFTDCDRRMRRRMMRSPDAAGTIVADPETVAEAVRAADSEADLVIVYMHWGIRYQRTPYPVQHEIARAAIDAGADIVAGHHTHIWQPVEVYKGRAILYGLGNFAFGSANRRADIGLLARAVFDDAGFSRIELYPLYTKNRDPRVKYQSKLMHGESARKLLDQIVRQSTGIDGLVEIRNDHAVLSLPD